MKNLIIMSSGHEKLFRRCYEEYAKRTGEVFEFVIIPDDRKNYMSTIKYCLFKYNLFGEKKRFYDKLRRELSMKACECDRIIFYNLRWDDEYFIDDYVYHQLKGKDCRVTFADPMRELCEGFKHWDLFKSICTCEYSDIEGYARENELNAKFVSWGTKYFFRDNQPMTAKYDVCFVGLGTKERLRYLEMVAEYCYRKQIKLFIAGHFWHNSNCVIAWIEKQKFARKYPFLVKYVINKFIDPQDLFDIYCHSKICLNINTPGHYTFNSRNLDIMYAGSTVLTEKEDISGYDFVEGEHYYSCSSPEEMVEKIDLLLADERKLNVCREKAKKLVTEKYTYHQTIEAFLKG